MVIEYVVDWLENAYIVLTQYHTYKYTYFCHETLNLHSTWKCDECMNVLNTLVMQE